MQPIKGVLEIPVYARNKEHAKEEAFLSGLDSSFLNNELVEVDESKEVTVISYKEEFGIEAYEPTDKELESGNHVVTCEYCSKVDTTEDSLRGRDGIIHKSKTNEQPYIYAEYNRGEKS